MLLSYLLVQKKQRTEKSSTLTNSPEKQLEVV